MLRDSKKLRFDRLSPVARLTTVGAVLLCGLLVAGLRGPAGQPQALAEERTNDTLDDYIDISFLTENPSGIVIMRPSAVFARPELAVLAKLLEQHSGNMVPKGTRLADFRQITEIVLYPDLDMVTVYQWVEPIAEAYYADRVAEKKYTVREYNGKKMYVHAHSSQVILQYDDRTTIQTGRERWLKAYLASKRGVFPRWLPAKAWESFQSDHYVMAADMATIPIIRRGMKQFVDRSPPVAQAVFTLVSPLWEDSIAMAVGVKLDDRLAVHTRVATKDADSSERLRRTAEALKTLVQNAVENTRNTVQSGVQPENTTILAILDVADALLENLKFQQEGNEVQLETSVALDEAQIRGLLSPIAAARQAAQRLQAQNNMKQLALAMHNYAQIYRHFPPAVLYGPDGKTPYSWRVALLPYLEQMDLYKQYRFDEPWDGPNNRKLLEKMPAVFRCPNEPAGSTNASYFALVGPGAIFETRPRKSVPAAAGGVMGGGPMGAMPASRGKVPAWWPDDAPSGTTFQEIIDGTSNTIMLVEAKRNIPWTKPEDIPYDPEKPLPKLGGYFEDGFNVAIADGSVRFFPDTISEKILHLLITMADRQPVKVEDAMQSAQPVRPRAASTGGR